MVACQLPGYVTINPQAHSPTSPHLTTTPGSIYPHKKKLPNPTDLNLSLSKTVFNPIRPLTVTLPQTNTSHLLGTVPKGSRIVFQPIFGCEKMFVSGRVPTYLPPSEKPTSHLNLPQPPTQPPHSTWRIIPVSK